MDIKTLSGLLIVKLPLSMRQLIVGAIITESLNTKPILFTDSIFSGISPFFYLASSQLPLNYCHIRKGNSVKVNDIKVFRRNNSEFSYKKYL